MIGEVPATVLTEPVKLKMGWYLELIHFVVAPRMREVVILGLSWVDKWDPPSHGKVATGS